MLRGLTIAHARAWQRGQLQVPMVASPVHGQLQGRSLGVRREISAADGGLSMQQRAAGTTPY